MRKGFDGATRCFGREVLRVLKLVREGSTNVSTLFRAVSRPLGGRVDKMWKVFVCATVNVVRTIFTANLIPVPFPTAEHSHSRALPFQRSAVNRSTTIRKHPTVPAETPTSVPSAKLSK